MGQGGGQITSAHLLGPWRRGFQATVTALVALIPFIHCHGISLLRFDLPSLTMELVCQRFRIEEFYLLWIAVLGTIFLVILLTMTLGRLWCGFACPQTILADLIDWLERQKGLSLIRPVLYGFVSLWAGATVVWYFVSPAEFFARLICGHLGGWPAGTLLTVAALTLVNILWVRRLFCRDFCPYGRFQTVLTDNGTLTLQAHPAHLDRCIDCKSCLRVCPTGIDIRQGFQIECINCGRCRDACLRVMAKRGEEGIIRYTFGRRDLGWRSVLNGKTLGLALLVTGLVATALYLASHRAVATFKVGRAGQLASRVTEGGKQLTFFRASVVNRRQEPQRFRLLAANQSGQPLTIKGVLEFDLAGNDKRDLTLAVESPRLAGTAPEPITFRLEAEGSSVLTVAAYLVPAK